MQLLVELVSLLGKLLDIISDNDLISLVGNQALIDLVPPPLNELLKLGLISLPVAKSSCLLLSARYLLLFHDANNLFE